MPRTELCECDAFKPGIAQIDAALDLMRIHGAEYTAPPWMYCPWCGGKMWADAKTRKEAGE